jgi:hypothetical protein
MSRETMQNPVEVNMESILQKEYKDLTPAERLAISFFIAENVRLQPQRWWDLKRVLQVWHSSPAKGLHMPTQLELNYHLATYHQALLFNEKEEACHE